MVKKCIYIVDQIYSYNIFTITFFYLTTVYIVDLLYSLNIFYSHICSIPNKIVQLTVIVQSKLVSQTLLKSNLQTLLKNDSQVYSNLNMNVTQN